MFLNYIKFLLFIILVFVIALLVSWKIAVNTKIWNTSIWINEHTLTWVTLLDCKNEEIENKDLRIILEESSDDNSWDWITFLSILSTLLAAFFIYSSWKIDNDLRKIDDKYKEVNKDLKKKMSIIENDIRIHTLINKANMYLSTSRFEEWEDLLKNTIDNFNDWDEYLYTLYKTMADLYWVWWEVEMEKEESSDHQQYYLNAITNLKKAMEIDNGRDDDELLASYQDRYNYVIEIE